MALLVLYNKLRSDDNRAATLSFINVHVHHASLSLYGNTDISCDMIACMHAPTDRGRDFHTHHWSNSVLFAYHKCRSLLSSGTAIEAAAMSEWQFVTHVVCCHIAGCLQSLSQLEIPRLPLSLQRVANSM